MKDGIYTTEFWLSVLIIIAASVLCAFDKIDAQMWATVAGPVGAGYAISRGLAKRV